MGDVGDTILKSQLRSIFWRRFMVVAFQIVLPGLFILLMHLSVRYFGRYIGISGFSKTAEFIHSVVIYAVAIMVLMGICIALFAGYNAQTYYLHRTYSIVETAREMYEEEQYLKGKTFVLLFFDNEKGRWYSRRLGRDAEVFELRGISAGTPVEEVYKTGRRRFPNFEVSLVLCGRCGSLAENPKGELEGRLIKARYEFKKNRCGFPYAFGAYICGQCQVIEDRED